MAHDLAVDKKSGEVAMMYVGEMPWHSLGNYVGENCITWAETLKRAHVDFDAEKYPLYGPPALLDKDNNALIGMFDPLAKGPKQPRGAHLVYRQIPAWGVFRKDTGAFLSTVGPDYRVIQYREGGNWIDTLIGVSNGAHYETAGLIDGGRRMWAMARIPEADFVIGKNDRHQSRILFETSHDGTVAARLKITSTRVVCKNTLNMALASEGQLLRIKHTKSADEKFRQAKAMMNQVVTSTQELANKMKMLSERALTRESMTDIFDRMFPSTNKVEEVSTRRKNQISDILRLFESNDNNAEPQIRGTAYNLLNAVTEYTDHHRTARVTESRQGMTMTQARTESSLFGSGERFKNNALEIILEATEDANKPTRKTMTSSVSGGLLNDIISATEERQKQNIN